MDEEVVAKKANFAVGFIIFMAIGLIITIVGIVGFINPKDSSDLATLIGFIVGALIIIAAMVAGLISYFKTPKVFITYKDGKLHFADGTECAPHEIEHVLVKITRTNGIESSTGGLVITVYGRKIEYNAVKKVKAVESRLEELYNMSRKEYLLRLAELEKEAEESQDEEKISEIHVSDSVDNG